MAEPDDDVNRRNVLKMTGAAAMGGIAASGTVSAHSANCVAFKRCSRVEATGDLPGTYTVHLLDSSGNCTTDSVSGDGSHLSYRAPSGSKVLALDVDGTIHCNPNDCAIEGLSKCSISCDQYGQSGRCRDGDGDDGGTVTEGPVFCGCSQVCACVDGSATIHVARETGDGFTCSTVSRSGNFCYEVRDAKIIAVTVGGTTYCNPNQNCAGKALQACGISCDQRGERGGPCGKPPCEHPGRGNGGSNNGNGRRGGQ